MLVVNSFNFPPDVGFVRVVGLIFVRIIFDDVFSVICGKFPISLSCICFSCFLQNYQGILMESSELLPFGGDEGSWSLCLIVVNSLTCLLLSKMTLNTCLAKNQRSRANPGFVSDFGL